MDFDQLNAFLEVARLHSFSRAAVKCYRTQPAISAQIRLLEEEVGARLFDRGGGKVALTPAGRVFHDYAERLMTLRKEAIQSVADLDHTPRGELVVAANEGSCLHVLPQVFADFKRQHPAVQVQIRRGEHHDILERVLENRVDFGVLSLPVDDARLKIVPLNRDEIQVAVPPEHPLARSRDGSGADVSVEEVAQFPLLLPKSGNTRDALDSLFESIPQVNVSMELDSSELLKSFSAAGLGVAFVPRTLALAEVATGKLVLLPIRGRKIYRELGLIFRGDRALSRAALVFIDIAIKASREEGGAKPAQSSVRHDYQQMAK